MGGSAYIWAMGFLISIGTPDWYLDEGICIVEAIHFEANGEDIPGKRGIANVLQHRQDLASFPDTYCGVVDASGAFGHRGRNATLMDIVLTEPSDIVSFENTLIISERVLNGSLVDNTGRATHFYNPRVSNPSWATPERRTERIGNHQFVDVTD